MSAHPAGMGGRAPLRPRPVELSCTQRNTEPACVGPGWCQCDAIENGHSTRAEEGALREAARDTEPTRPGRPAPLPQPSRPLVISKLLLPLPAAAAAAS